MQPAAMPERSKGSGPSTTYGERLFTCNHTFIPIADVSFFQIWLELDIDQHSSSVGMLP